MTRRLLLTADEERCPLGCVYCFSSFGDYKRPVSLHQVCRNQAILQGVDIVYPACDTELFARTDVANILSIIIPWQRSVSISTKMHLDSTMIHLLLEAHTQLLATGHILKVSVSIPTKSCIKSIEPGTASYEERIETLAALAEVGIPSSVNLKPILPDLPPKEYMEILKDIVPYVQDVLLGDEYVNKMKPRLPHLVCNAEHRYVKWAHDTPVWSAIIAPAQRQVIASDAKILGIRCWESDLTFMEYLICKTRGGENCLNHMSKLEEAVS